MVNTPFSSEPKGNVVKISQTMLDLLTKTWYHNRLPRKCKLLRYKE